jgi:hypothetical protein
MKTRMLALAFSLLMTAAAFGQSIDSAIYVKNFPGATVGDKVANAQKTCSTTTALPCLLVLDPSLAVAAPGTIPTLCSHCFLVDWRTPPPWSAGGGNPCAPVNAIQLANSGVNGFNCDPSFLIDPVTHRLTIGGPISGPHFTFTNLSTIPTNWTFDFTTPATARAAMGIGSFGTQNAPTGSTQCLQANSAGVVSGTGATCGAGGFTTGTNSNGTWVQDPTGTITQRGSITVTNGSGTLATGTITFPMTFPTSLDSLIVSGGGYANGSSQDSASFYSAAQTTSGATAIMRCSVNIGGSGCASISNTVTIYWLATGK